MSSRDARFENAIAQLNRYGTPRELIISLLEAVGDLSDDLENDRLAGDSISKLRELLRLAPCAHEPHWNSPDVLPPVGCPIVLRIGCAVVQAERTAHIERRDREMTYKLPTGQELVGRYEWSYP